MFSEIELSSFNCTVDSALIALRDCSGFNSSPDRISFTLLNEIASKICRPNTVICQQSFNAGKFPTIYKHAIIVLLYRRKENRNLACGCRSISLCSCIGKMFEKIYNAQLTEYLYNNDLQHVSQHNFCPYHLTRTNLLVTDKAVTDTCIAGHVYDVISFDFQKAFDKMPHSSIVKTLKRFEVYERTLF